MSLSKAIAVGGAVSCMLLSFFLARHFPQDADIISMLSVLAGYLIAMTGAYYLYMEVIEEAG